MESKKTRRSNIELLRIVAALGVIILHYNNPNIGGGFGAAAKGSFNLAILHFFEVVFICAVNLFVLISGYFLRDSKKCDLLKPIELLTQLFVFELLFLCIKEIPTGNPITIGVIFTYFSPSYWFVFVYIGLYLISPYISAVWKRLKIRDKKILLGGTFTVFALYPMLLNMIEYLADCALLGINTVGLYGAQEGYTIVNFVLMYLLGCAVRDWEESGKHRDVKTGKIAALLLANILVLFLWVLTEMYLLPRDVALGPSLNYNNPLVITEAVLFFLLFKQIHIKNSRVINALAAASFPSYLIHLNLLGYCSIAKAVQGNPLLMLAHLIGCTIGVYLASFLIHLLYQLAARPFFAFVGKHWKRHRSYTVELEG